MDDEIPEGVVTVVGAFQTPTEDPLKKALQIASTWPRILGCLKSCALDAVPSGRFAYAVRHLDRELSQYGFFIQSHRNKLTGAALAAKNEIRIGDANFSSASTAVFEIATRFFGSLHDAVPNAFSADDDGELFSIDESYFVLPETWPACRNAVNSFFDDKFLHHSDEQNLLTAIEKELAILFPEFGRGTLSGVDFKGHTPIDEMSAAPVEIESGAVTSRVGKKDRRRMSRSEANSQAMKLAKADSSFAKAPTVRRWAKEIGCSIGLVGKLPFWQECQRRLGKSPRITKPKTVSLSETLQAKLGKPDAELERLIGEQDADLESSPLEYSARRPHSRRPSV